MTTLFNYDPYYDDFDEDKNFMRVLFRPGYSVQARELTQLQTILSNQIEKFGNHIFKSGSPIVGGKVSLDDKANYVILQPQYGNEDIVVTDFLDKIVVSYGSTKDVRAKVIAVESTTSNPILVLKYLSGERFAESDELRVFGQNIFGTLVNTAATGGSYVAYLQEGVYYFKGQFVKVVPQYLIVELFYRLGSSSTINSQPSYKVGIEFTEVLVDEIDDTSLLDPAQGAFNYQAPGANRFQIQTALAKRTLDSADVSSFFEVIRLVAGVRTKEIQYPIYSEIETLLARRTFDESGNYTVDPFVISIDEGDSANGMFNVVLDPGKAYVNGYEFQTIAPTTIELARGRDVSNVSSYDLPTNYESSVVLDNIRGTLNITTYPQLDIHIVPRSSINLSTTATYNSTKIGTTRANMMRYNDSTSSTIGDTHSFTVNVFDAVGSAITGTVPAGSSTTTIKLPTTFSATAGANVYANMLFRIVSGDLAEDGPLPIVSSNATYITLSTSLSKIPSTANGDSFSIESDFKQAESLVITDGTSITFSGNINSDSKNSLTGFAYINEPKRSSLLFNVPYDAIKDGTIDNMDLYARKAYLNRTSDAGGSITINAGGTDSFAFAGAPGVISDSLILNNIICTVRSGVASNTQYGISANSVLSLANNNFTVTAVSPTQFTVNLVVPGVSVDFLITTKVNNAENASTGSTRGKQMTPLTSGANLHAKVPSELGGANTLDAANTSGEVTTFGGGYVFTSVGATNFTGNSILTDLRTPGKPVSLQVADVYEIVGVYDSKSPTANVSTAMLTTAVNNITDSYEFDNGQKKNYYDHATIKLKRGYSAPTGTVYVQYRYQRHIASPATGGAGLFTVDSYLQAGSNMSYGDISVFANNEDQKLLPLRSAFDFRPTRAVASTTLYGALNPEPLEQITMDYDYYLSRIDQVVVKSSREFAVIKGKSAINPIAAPVNSKDMLIYTLFVPAYTDSVNDVRADFKNHRRYTMGDLQNFEDRISGLEYYVSLSTLEKDAASTKVLDANGLERSKYGILVDNFTSKDNQATRDEVNFDNRNLIENGTLQPASLMRTVKLIPRTGDNVGSAFTAGTGTKKAMMLSYTSREFAKQPYATKSMTIADAVFANFKGKTKLFPEFSGDVDTGSTAKVTLNSNQGISNAFNFINDAFKYISDKTPTWQNDKDSPFATIADSQWYKTVREVDRNKATVQSLGGNTWGWVAPVNDNTYLTAGAELKQKQISTSSSQVNLGSFVTDLAIQPYMKSKQILFTSEGVRPKTVMYSFFDDTDVNKYIVVPNQVTLNTASQTLRAGESVLIANTIADLTANLVSLIAGGTSYDPAFVVVSERGSANVSIINETGKTLAGKFVYGLDTGRYYTISTINEHRSGLGNTTTTTITLDAGASSANGYYTGNTVTIVRAANSNDGLGQQHTITAYNGTTKVANVSGTIATTGQVIYSIGNNKTNKLGQVGGAFYMPKATFRSGQRTFRVTESFNNTYDADSISFADKTYTASGLIANKTELIESVLNVDVDFKITGTQTSDKLVNSVTVGSQVLSSWAVDPLAQTFFVDAELYPQGLFLDSIDLFFRAKDDNQLPVTVQIRPTVNGFPSSDFWYPESVVTKYPSEIVVSESPSILDATNTNFKFDIPVFLKPGLYAMVLLTDSPQYSVWEAEKGGTTRNNEYVDKQPYSGTLYKSQNAREFSPFINEDLMFKINRCVFSTTSAVHVLQNEGLTTPINMDKIRLLETAIVPSDTLVNVERTILTTPLGGTKESTPRAISPGQIYSFASDELYAVGFRRKSIGTQNSFTMRVAMSTTNDAISPVISLESAAINVWENFLDNAVIDAEDFTIVSPGSGYSNSNNITITSSTGTGATANLSVDANGNVVGIYVSAGGSGYLDDFTISYPLVGSGTVTANANIVLNSEHDSSGGPCLARYITKPITLADGYDAGDLRVFLGANKPGSSEVSVYYKILSGNDNTTFKDRGYQKMVCINPTTTPSLDPSFREYEYRPSATVNAVSYVGENGVTHDTFKTFAIKIVLTSSDPAVVPTVKDLRIIATPAE